VFVWLLNAIAAFKSHSAEGNVALTEHLKREGLLIDYRHLVLHFSFREHSYRAQNAGPLVFVRCGDQWRWSANDRMAASGFKSFLNTFVPKLLLCSRIFIFCFIY
jgi:hypothetical protein